MNLHPDSFTETAVGCDLRRIRSQPSRETAGVLLNECEAKYASGFDLPYRNIARYISELEQSWDKLTPADKTLVTRNLSKHVPGLRNGLRNDVQQLASPTILSFLKDYVSLDPEKNTKELLDALYHPSDTIKSAITESKAKSIKKSFDEWSGDQSIFFHSNMKTFFVFVLFMILFFVIGGASCRNMK